MPPLKLEPVDAALVPSITLPLMGAYLFGGSRGSVWYQQLTKPWWCPQPLQMRNIWLGTYGLIGYAQFRVLKQLVRGGTGKHPQGGTAWQRATQPKMALVLYTVQLALGYLKNNWQFRNREFQQSGLIMLVHYGINCMTCQSFFRVDKVSGRLSLAYCAWLTVCLYMQAWMARYHSQVETKLVHDADGKSHYELTAEYLNKQQQQQQQQRK